MGRDVVLAKLDIIFKKLFSENEDLLHDFGDSILDILSESIKLYKLSIPSFPLKLRKANSASLTSI